MNTLSTPHYSIRYFIPMKAHERTNRTSSGRLLAKAMCIHMPITGLQIRRLFRRDIRNRRMIDTE